jgi:hypothetical protein
MTQQPTAPAPRDGDAHPATADETRQMEAAEPRRRTEGRPGYPAAFGSTGGGVVFRDYASI